MITNSLEVAATAAAAGVAEPAIEVRGVRKSYDGGVQALDGVDLTVRRGEVLAAARPERRRQDHPGRDPRGPPPRRRRRGRGCSASTPAAASARFRERIGIVLQEGAVDAKLTVREAVELYSAAYPSPRPAGEVVDLVGLGPVAGARAETLSGGQRRRLDLAIGIGGDPELLFLDEPTTGFDPAARRQSWDLIDAPALARQDDPADHALHGRGAAPRRPRRRDRAAAA